MSKFEVVGTMDPFLSVTLNQGEKIFAESDAMVTMDGTIDLKGKMQGGFFKALSRSFAGGESFFLQEIEAVRGSGKMLLSPDMPGHIVVLNCGEKQYHISDTCFLASDVGVSIEQKSQGIGKALFGGTGGFLVMQTAGAGNLAVSGFGAITEMQVSPGNDLIIDNGHVVAWDTGLQYEVTVTTAGGSSGMFSKIVNSQTSGEGLVLRYSGSGKVYVCSRNFKGFLNFIISRLPSKS